VRAAVNAFGVCCVHPSESSADHFSVRRSQLGWFVFEDLIRRTRFPVRLSICNVETRCRFFPPELSALKLATRIIDLWTLESFIIAYFSNSSFLNRLSLICLSRGFKKQQQPFFLFFPFCCCFVLFCSFTRVVSSWIFTSHQTTQGDPRARRLFLDYTIIITTCSIVVIIIAPLSPSS